MKATRVWAGMLAVGMGIALVMAARAQDELPMPSPAEKVLADKAKHVTEVTLDKSMLAFAAKFIDKDEGDDKDSQAVKDMIRNLKGVYVRDYEFDKDNSYSAADLAALRKYFEGSEWSPMVHERTKGEPEGTDVYVKLVNGQMQGLYVLDAEPRELSLVLILGPIDIDKVAELSGNFGIPKEAGKRIKKAEKEAGK
ncbi:DUF4252 domain-containing protein [Acidicapsa dinghuensis]|uniref:DUF4252 domain-containing protein n=1 Tax=Acidicapsa dinghuensis TaxID=2218256 RepID=A0ABW1EET9_9BACT|nr:DUF4252 domain-containing protein [Acidicapsa dinghuensis]